MAQRNDKQMQNTVLGAPEIIVLHFEWNLLVESFWRVFFSSHYGSIMCSIHCATDETGSCTGQNGGCPGGLRPVRGQEAIPPRSLVAPKEAVASSSSWHTQGEWLWPLGLGPERNKVRLPDSCTVVWVHMPLMGWKSDPLKLWPSTLCSLGFWCIISLLWKKGRWNDENAAGRGHAWVLFAEPGSSFPQDVVRVLLDRACERKLLTVLPLWIITGVRHLGFRHKLKTGFGNCYKTWNSIFYSSHVMKVFSAGSGSVYSWLQHWAHLPEPDVMGQEIWGLRPRRGVARCSRSHNHSLTKHGIFYF